MTALDLLQRQRSFIERQERSRDFTVQLRPFLETLRRNAPIRAHLESLRAEAHRQRAAFVAHDADATQRLVTLGNDIRTMFPCPDPPRSQDEPIRPWEWARFDQLAIQKLELDAFEIPDEQNDQTVSGKLLQFIQGRLRDIANRAQQSGDLEPAERSSVLWNRFNDEERSHEYAVREFHIQERIHAGCALRRTEHVVRLLNYLPTSDELAASGGLDFTPWQPVARAVNYMVFGRKPDPPLDFDYDRESAELFTVIRSDVDRLCEALYLNLSATLDAASSADANADGEREASAEPQPPAATEIWSETNHADPPFEDISLDRVASLLPIDALIMTAVAVEVRAARRRLTPLPGFSRVLRVAWEESTYYIGQIGKYSCAVAMSDAGSVGRSGAVLTLYDAVARLRPSFALAVGIAFGRDATTQRIGDVLISTLVIPYENERVQAAGSIPRAPHPEAGMVLLNRLRTLESEDVLTVKMRFGPLLSGEKLVDDSAFKADLLAKHPTAIGGEMEAAGIYAAAARSRLEWVVIKSICDWGDGSKSDDHQKTAAENASEVVDVLLRRDGLERRVFFPNDGASPRAQLDEMPEVEVSTNPFFRSPRPGRGRRGD